MKLHLHSSGAQDTAASFQRVMGACHREISTNKVCLLGGLGGERRAAAHTVTTVVTLRLGWALASPSPTNYPRKQQGQCTHLLLTQFHL